jgi:hypothetical protein
MSNLEIIKNPPGPNAEGWGNCPKCDWYYNLTAIQLCPMCRHNWQYEVTYTQPPYEPPTLS